MRATLLTVGEPAPWFACRTAANPRYVFDTVAGRYVILCFFRSAADSVAARVLEAVAAHRRHFDDVKASFFGVSTDPDDERRGRVADAVPGLRFFWDFDGRAAMG